MHIPRSILVCLELNRPRYVPVQRSVWYVHLTLNRPRSVLVCSSMNVVLAWYIGLND